MRVIALSGPALFPEKFLQCFVDSFLLSGRHGKLLGSEGDTAAFGDHFV
jgi:hypothetical protein